MTEIGSVILWIIDPIIIRMKSECQEIIDRVPYNNLMSEYLGAREDLLSWLGAGGLLLVVGISYLLLNRISESQPINRLVDWIAKVTHLDNDK